MGDKNISIIAGATGLVGAEVVTKLEAIGDPLIVLARRTAPNTANNTTWIETDFDKLVAGEPVPPCDHVYICLGTTIATAGSQAAFWTVDFDYALAVAKQAREAGATTVSLISSVGADANSKNFYLRTKGALENAICELGFSTVDIYRPSFLLGNRTENRQLEALGKFLFQVVGPLLVGPLQKYRGIQSKTLAAAMVGNARNTNKADGIQYFHYKEICDSPLG